MCPDTSDKPPSTAIEQLKAFGLSTYAAQTFVALVSLGDGTAQDVSDVSEVPRTRVYDAAAELHDHGLVDIQHSSPKRFVPISSETTGRKFHQDFAHRANVLTDALDDLEPVFRSTEQRGVWTVTGRENITDRVVTFIENATDEIVYMTVEELLVEECLEALQVASDRDVTIRLAGLASDVREDIQQEIPEAEVFESIWEWSDMPAGRLLMVDQEKTLASVLVTGDGEHPTESSDETAIWGMGKTNSLVVVLKALFTWQLDGNRDEYPERRMLLRTSQKYFVCWSQGAQYNRNCVRVPVAAQVGRTRTSTHIHDEAIIWHQMTYPLKRMNRPQELLNESGTSGASRTVRAPL